MKPALRLLLLTMAIALAGYFLFYELATRRAKTLLAHPDCGMVWLRHEYHLSDAQYAKITQMHADYRPTCEQMCQRIAAASEKINRLLASPQPTPGPEIEEALKEWALLQNDCRVAMLRHVYAVSAVMNAEDGKRYVQMAAARIVAPGMEHSALLDK